MVVSESNQVVAPPIQRGGFFSNLATGLKSLLKGMGITFHYFSRPSTVVTQQYPENRATLKMFDRYRMRLSLPHDENGFHKCTACTICEQACPNSSIRIVSRKGAVTNKTELDRFIWRMDSCTFCNACVVACPFSCLKMSGDFECSVYDKSLLVFNLTRYAGPTSTVLMKVTDPQERAKMWEPRDVYSGPVPLRGTAVPGGGRTLGAPEPVKASAPVAAPTPAPATAPAASATALAVEEEGGKK
ncbi:MAG: 4Fe-4S binding protein [Oligoflexia bacterium]|nr:4Fe-4S binding protein [Oligoflexia bacterium]